MKTKGQFILMNVTEFAEWLAAYKCTRSIKHIQQHHTYMPDYSCFRKDNHFSMLEGMKAYHVSRGFSDIAQNITIFPDGLVAICRPLRTVPAGIIGANAYGICIENVGNFDIGRDRMTDAQKDAIVRVTALLCKKFNLKPSVNTIVYHHWYDCNTGKRTDGYSGTCKSCPGLNFFGGNAIEFAESIFIPMIKDTIG